MKKLKIAFCAMFVILSGCVFVACSDNAPKKEFDISKIEVGAVREFVYDANPHVYEVSYEDVKLNVTYALDLNDNFVPVNKLTSVDVNTYSLYYKISAKGYKSYTSTEAIDITVLPRDLIVTVTDMVGMKSDNIKERVLPAYSLSNTADDHNAIPLTFTLKDFDPNNIAFGNVYDIIASTTNTNYNLICNQATYTVKDYIQVEDNTGNVVDNFGTLQEAIDNVESGTTLILNKNMTITETVNVNKSIVIDGRGLYKITAKSSFTDDNLFLVNKQGVELTLKDVTVNANKKARGIKVSAGKLVVNNATIQNGMAKDYAGGVFITGAAQFEMVSGKIIGNDCAEEKADRQYYHTYSTDLWIGSQAQGALVSINGGEIGNVFVNANEYSSNNASFKLDGGVIDNIYVEYDRGYGATFNYIDGTVNHILIALKNEKGNFCGVYQEVEAVKGTQYIGGKISYTDNIVEFVDQVYTDNIDSLLEEGGSYIFENCTFETAVYTTKKVGLTFNNCTFNAGNTAAGNRCLYVTSTSNLVVNNCTFNGEVTKGNSSAAYTIEVNQYSADCSNVFVTNNVFNTTSADVNVAISIKARLGATDTPNSAVDTWATDATAGTIDSVVIGGNTFNNENNSIYLGTSPKGLSTSANTTSGDFNVVVSDNLTGVTVYKRYIDDAISGVETKVVLDVKEDYKRVK